MCAQVAEFAKTKTRRAPRFIEFVRASDIEFERRRLSARLRSRQEEDGSAESAHRTAEEDSAKRGRGALRLTKPPSIGKSAE